MSTPLRAAAASAATIDTGVEMTSAHGHDTTSSTSARYTDVVPAHAERRAADTVDGTAASAITAGV